VLLWTCWTETDSGHHRGSLCGASWARRWFSRDGLRIRNARNRAAKAKGNTKKTLNILLILSY